MNKILLLVFFLFGCSSQPKFTHTVDHINLENYMGTWYVQAGRFTPFEKDVTNSIEIYTWNEEKNRIDIDFSYNQGSFDGKLISMPQYARVYNTTTNAHWKVSPIWFLQFDFLVIAHADDDSWTVIGVPNQAYLWVMTRHKHPDTKLIDDIVEKVKALNYNMENIVFVKHQYD